MQVEDAASPGSALVGPGKTVHHVAGGVPRMQRDCFSSCIFSITSRLRQT